MAWSHGVDKKFARAAKFEEFVWPWFQRRKLCPFTENLLRVLLPLTPRCSRRDGAVAWFANSQSIANYLPENRKSCYDIINEPRNECGRRNSAAHSRTTVLFWPLIGQKGPQFRWASRFPPRTAPSAARSASGIRGARREGLRKVGFVAECRKRLNSRLYNAAVNAHIRPTRSKISGF